MKWTREVIETSDEIFEIQVHLPFVADTQEFFLNQFPGLQEAFMKEIKRLLCNLGYCGLDS